jgi:hypothetical protein
MPDCVCRLLQRRTGTILAAEVLFMVAVILITLLALAFHLRTTFVGIVAVFVTVGMYTAPLGKMVRGSNNTAGVLLHGGVGARGGKETNAGLKVTSSEVCFTDSFPLKECAPLCRGLHRALSHQECRSFPKKAPGPCGEREQPGLPRGLRGGS